MGPKCLATFLLRVFTIFNNRDQVRRKGRYNMTYERNDCSRHKKT